MAKAAGVKIIPVSIGNLHRWLLNFSQSFYTFHYFKFHPLSVLSLYCHLHLTLLTVNSTQFYSILLLLLPLSYFLNFFNLIYFISVFVYFWFYSLVIFSLRWRLLISNYFYIYSRWKNITNIIQMDAVKCTVATCSYQTCLRQNPSSHRDQRCSIKCCEVYVPRGMLCHVMLCFVGMLCYFMIWYVVLCYVLYYLFSTSSHTTTRFTLPFFIILNFIFYIFLLLITIFLHNAGCELRSTTISATSFSLRKMPSRWNLNSNSKLFFSTFNWRILIDFRCLLLYGHILSRKHNFNFNVYLWPQQ